jgi:CRP-like cAMP-binding protein
MDKLIQPLMQVSAFVGLSEPQLSEIARHAQKIKFLPGDTITTAGAPADGAFVLISGPAERVAEASQGGGEVLAPGSLVGEMAMLIPHDYGATVKARDWVFCAKILRTAMHAQMREDALLREHFERRVTARLIKVAEELRLIDGVLAQHATPAAPAPAVL